MKTKFLLFCCAVLSVFANGAEDAWLSSMLLPFERGSQTPPVVSIFYNLGYSGIGKKHTNAVIAYIWADGRAVWSRNHTAGGAPYFTGKIELKRLAEFMVTVDKRGIFARKGWGNLGPDCSTHDINIIDGNRRVSLSSMSDYRYRENIPATITDEKDALSFLRREIEHILPRQGQQLGAFDYELRRIK